MEVKAPVQFRPSISAATCPSWSEGILNDARRRRYNQKVGADMNILFRAVSSVTVKNAICSMRRGLIQDGDTVF